MANISSINLWPFKVNRFFFHKDKQSEFSFYLKSWTLGNPRSIISANKIMTNIFIATARLAKTARDGFPSHSDQLI